MDKIKQDQQWHRTPGKKTKLTTLGEGNVSGPDRILTLSSQEDTRQFDKNKVCQLCAVRIVEKEWTIYLKMEIGAYGFLKATEDSVWWHLSSREPQAGGL